MALVRSGEQLKRKVACIAVFNFLIAPLFAPNVADQ
jgi:hypothetical protein